MSFNTNFNILRQFANVDQAQAALYLNFLKLASVNQNLQKDNCFFLVLQISFGKSITKK